MIAVRYFAANVDEVSEIWLGRSLRGSSSIHAGKTNLTTGGIVYKELRFISSRGLEVKIK